MHVLSYIFLSRNENTHLRLNKRSKLTKHVATVEMTRTLFSLMIHISTILSYISLQKYNDNIKLVL